MKNFKKNAHQSYVDMKVDAMNSISFLNDEPLEYVLELSNIVKEKLADRRTYMFFKNLDQSKTKLYYHFLMIVMIMINEEKKLTKMSAITWIVEYLDTINKSNGSMDGLLEELSVDIQSMM